MYENYYSITGLDREDKAFYQSYFTQVIYKRLPIDKNAHILDVGCGYGKYLSLLHSLGYHNAIGIDCSEEQIERARERGVGQIAQSDAITYLRDKDNAFDAIMLVDVLEHIPLTESHELLHLMYKALKPGGKVIIQVPNALAPFSPLRYGDITHLRAYTPSSLAQSLRLGKFTTFNFTPIYPCIRGIKSGVRAVLTKFIFYPIVKSCFYLTCGNAMGGIYTPNLLAVAEKP